MFECSFRIPILSSYACWQRMMWSKHYLHLWFNLRMPSKRSAMTPIGNRFMVFGFMLVQLENSHMFIICYSIFHPWASVWLDYNPDRPNATNCQAPKLLKSSGLSHLSRLVANCISILFCFARPEYMDSVNFQCVWLSSLCRSLQQYYYALQQRSLPSGCQTLL